MPLMVRDLSDGINRRMIVLTLRIAVFIFLDEKRAMLIQFCLLAAQKMAETPGGNQSLHDIATNAHQHTPHPSPSYDFTNSTSHHQPPPNPLRASCHVFVDLFSHIAVLGWLRYHHLFSSNSSLPPFFPLLSLPFSSFAFLHTLSNPLVAFLSEGVNTF